MRACLPQEYRLNISVCNKYEITLICTKADTTELILGYLYNEKIIHSLTDVKGLNNHVHSGCVEVQLNGQDPSFPQKQTRPSSLGGNLLDQNPGITRKEIQQVYTSAYIEKCRKICYRNAVEYQKSGGMHCSALFDENGLIAFYEDIGRHNTIDKLAGHCLRKGIAVNDALLITSGRISSDMVRKAARLGATVIASYTTPTQNAYEIAAEAGLTLIGYLRGNHMCVYCGEERIQD